MFRHVGVNVLLVPAIQRVNADQSVRISHAVHLIVAVGAVIDRADPAIETGMSNTLDRDPR